MRQSKDGIPMTIVGDGSQTRDFTNVFDVVQANLLAMKSSQEVFGEIYNIGSGKRFSIMEVAKMIGTDWVNIAPRIGEATDSLADISKAKSKLGYSPERDLGKWIRDNIDH